MNVLVLGSSNSIGPSAFPVHMANMLSLADTDVRVVNHSIGASPGSAGLYGALAADLSGFDVAIIDFEINESGLMGRQLRTADEVGAVMQALIFELRRHGVTPLITVLPTKLGQRGETMGERAHIAAAQSASVPWLNLSTLFRRLDAEGGKSAALMRDDVHMNHLATPIVGRLFARAVEHVMRHPAKQVSEPVPPQRGRAVLATDITTGDAVVERASRLRTSQCAVLQTGSELMLPVAEDERLIALVVNTGAPGAMVEFTAGAQRVVKRMICCWNTGAPDNLVVQTMDLRDAMRGGADGIRLRILSEDAAQTEQTLHQMAPLPGRYGRVEIEAALVMRATAGDPVLAEVVIREGLEPDLLQHLPLDDLLAELKMESLRSSANSA